MFEEFLFDLKVARKKSGLTQADCGHLMGLSTSTMSEIELGERTPTAQEMCILSLIFGTSFESFYAENMRLARSALRDNFDSMPDVPEGWQAAEAREKTLKRLSDYLDSDLPEIA